jgi:hypothetical protein
VLTKNAYYLFCFFFGAERIFIFVGFVLLFYFWPKAKICFSTYGAKTKINKTEGYSWLCLLAP